LFRGFSQMWRFILVTFGFLFFAFYELSGGAHYTPKDGSRQSVAAERAQAAEQKRLAFLQAKPQAKPRDVATASSPVSSSATLSAAPPAPDVSGVITGGAETLVLASAGGSALPRQKPLAVALSQPVIDSEKAESLIEVAAGAITARADDDIREVSGNRVNLRRGPGTRFNTLDTLLRGDKVQVLSEESGWIKLRVLETGRIGYMAAFLLAEPN